MYIPKISTKASPYRNLLPSIGGGCKDYQGIKTGGWKFSGAGCVSRQNYWCCRNVQREVLKCAISNVQCVVAVATQLACSIWIMHYIFYIIITILIMIMIYDICFQNVDQVTILHSPSFLVVLSSQVRTFFEPCTFRGQWCLSWRRCSPIRCCGSSYRHRRMRFVETEPCYFRGSHSHTMPYHKKLCWV